MVPTETAIEWAAKRAEKTGRVVPKSFIESVHKAVSQIIPEAIKEGLFDELNLYDNRSGQGVLVASAKGSKLQVHD